MITTHNGSASKNNTSLRWDLAQSLGLISVIVVVAGTVLVAVSGAFGIRRNMAQIVPQTVRDFFQRDTLIPVRPDLGNAARDAILAVGPVSETPSHRRRESFGIGDSEATVLRIQGKPTLKADNVWHYGKSQVTFVAGRVVGWNNSPASPLLVR